MRLSKTLRAPAYLLGAGLTVAVIVWAESEIWYGFNFLRDRTETISSEGFHRSDSLGVHVRQLNDLVFRYSLDPSPDGRARIKAENLAFQQWLTAQQVASGTPEHREHFVRFLAQLDAYRDHIRPVVTAETLPPNLELWRAQQEKIVGDLLTNLRELGVAEQAALKMFLAQTRSSMDMLYRKLIISSVVLVTMGAGLAALLYQGFIAPLRKRLKQTRVVLERQEKLSSLGVLAAGVAHEIRNPLTSIKARLFTQQALLEEKSEALEDNVFIAEEISRLEKIVRDFLAFARPSEPQMAVLRAAQTFRDLDGLVRRSLDKANITLKHEFLADPHIQADSHQLKQVLLNLVQNAAESIGRDGVITLRTRTEARNRVRGSGHVAVLEVEDTGKGIPFAAQKRLFDPFFTTKPSGTGLGLSIAARILEKHGGSLEYQSEPNRGTVFRLVLPIAPIHESDKNTAG